MDYGRYDLLIKLDREGHYVGWVKYRGVRIGPPKFTIISLSGETAFYRFLLTFFIVAIVLLLFVVVVVVVIVVEKDMQTVETNTEKSKLNIRYEGVTAEKAKKVHCSITPRVSTCYCHNCSSVLLLLLLLLLLLFSSLYSN